MTQNSKKKKDAGEQPAANKNQEVQDAVAEEVQAAPPPPTLGIADLAGLVKILDLAKARDAFAWEEMQEIGPVYARLKQFVIYSQQQAQAEAESKGGDADAAGN